MQERGAGKGRGRGGRGLGGDREGEVRGQDNEGPEPS